MDKTTHVKRQATRHQIKLPVRFEQGTGVTRDISLAGIYFTTDRQLEAGQQLEIFVKLSYAIPGKSLHLGCRGQVLRVENQDHQYGVAAQFSDITYLH